MKKWYEFYSSNTAAENSNNLLEKYNRLTTRRI